MQDKTSVDNNRDPRLVTDILTYATMHACSRFERVGFSTFPGLS